MCFGNLTRKPSRDVWPNELAKIHGGRHVPLFGSHKNLRYQSFIEATLLSNPHALLSKSPINQPSHFVAHLRALILDPLPGGRAVSSIKRSRPIAMQH